METGNRTLNTTSILTMVAIDSDGKPTPVPSVHPETEEEVSLFQSAQLRKEKRLFYKNVNQ